MTNPASRVLAVNYKGSVSTRGEAASHLKTAGDIVLVKRGRPRLLVMLCPSGCGDELVVNLDPRAGSYWRVYHNKKGMTLFPSVWRESGCGSHFIIWGNRVYWCDYDWALEENDIDVTLPGRVLDVLKGHGLLHYRDIAELLGEIPWSVLVSCRSLVKRGELREGDNKFKDHFQITKHR